MGYTVFYEEAKKEHSNITWKDILSESFKSHSSNDLEYALSAGSAYDTASTETMLKKWHKPWVWTRMFLLLCIIGFGFLGLYQLIGNAYSGSNIGICMVIVLTCITPITSMVLFWELNVARDVSIFKLVSYFLLGGILSLVFTFLLGQGNVIDNAVLEITNQRSGAWLAPFTEEPAKFLATLIILNEMVKKGKNIFGCSGLAVGAGVGTGFTLFESFGYVICTLLEAGVYYVLNAHSPTYTGLYSFAFKYSLLNVAGRSIPGINFHMFMCVPYAAILAYNYHQSKSWKDSILNGRLLAVFALSCLLHGLWNSSYAEKLGYFGSGEFTISYLHIVLVIAALLINLYVIRLCLRQAVMEGDYVSGQGMALGERTNAREDVYSDSGNSPVPPLNLFSIGSVMNGRSWSCTGTAVIGRDQNCFVSFPGDTPGLSRNHVELKNYGTYWTVRDMNSSYGTRVNNVPITPNVEYQLSSGCVIECGTPRVRLTVR